MKAVPWFKDAANVVIGGESRPISKDKDKAFWNATWNTVLTLVLVSFFQSIPKDLETPR